MTMTGVGYGDITPQNRMEYVISCICMTCVGYTWAYIVGSVVATISRIDPSATVFTQKLDELSELSRRRGLPHALKVRLRGYMHETRHFTALSEQRKLLEMCLSDGLQREVAARSAEVACIVKGVFWMRDLEEDAILDIVRKLQPAAFGVHEVLNLPECMFMMLKGIVGVRGRVLTRGDMWGHIEILIESPHLKDPAMPRTISFVEMLQLTKNSLLEICRRYPKVDRRLRRAQIRTAVFRQFCYLAKHERARKVLLRTGVGRRRHDDEADNPLAKRMTGSFLNLDQQIHLTSLSTEAARCDLPELKRLLTQILVRQDAIEKQLDVLRHCSPGQGAAGVASSVATHVVSKLMSRGRSPRTPAQLVSQYTFNTNLSPNPVEDEAT
eukprot:CAMPEP_0195151742 /NCGR_PEP_ID=MMETSP0448-20130528/181111_1 /TAXON_ID=66468 /ORGANISM="Heterocapsa triquestra, Strain CCMP 448" /LENGTH=382 /DNA_ID=CAMNT_0040190459 /DNA_START=44 /DNA_END=1188 /DNA_ORIENTATION=+